MRVFLCTFKGFGVAIPMSSVASVALHANESTEYGIEGDKSTISLPRLFNLPDEIIRHIIIMKNQSSEDNYTEENNIMLLTTEIECEMDISDQPVFPLPKALSATRFSTLFSGIQFNSNKLSDNATRLILLLNCEELNRFTQKKEAL